MPDHRRDYDKELEAIMNGLADSVIKESAEELANDLRAEGLNPVTYAEETRQLMLDAIKAQKQQALIKARRMHKDSVAAYEQRKVHLPATPVQRRAVFDRALQKDPSLRQLTMQHRELTELTDEDIQSYLRQLHELNALTDDDLKDE